MAKSQMVINYVPGEECRVAVVYDGKLNELHAERMDNVSHVGNIYVGKVVNVEAAIQAAFVDFGLEHNGFLHVSDLHPQYFPGEGDETTERVGKKTPRRDRPPIQACLRRGDEVAVQVLKEGVGTKGPTVTSYLSIPGRFLVMMPQMDRVGVSRKVEDEETRRKMREILDQLDLPEGFGFILRTAGMDRGKMELKRDLAYLQRLWKDMEKRWKSGNKPRLLYSESDLLVRALRDILSTEIDEVVVDNEAALTRAAKFLKIVAPRSSTKLIHYTGKAPIFHVMGLEEQIQMIHAREVPLPSGGRLVIDETEALVAIDVNSGKSRDARDAETNAYRTNMEATEEICRQLRLRDLGGVIVNDLIDMRFVKHRRDVENLWKELLKKDRARWTIAPISEFGILEMTRQRMRGSHESQHFADCPTCRGRGLVQRPDSVATESLRDLAALLDHERVHRMEMVVNSRIAGELLSTKRRALSRIERASGKHVDVRVSDAIPVDRVTYYAYDDRGADLDITKLGSRQAHANELVEYALPRAAATDDWATEAPVAEPESVEESHEAVAELAPHPIELEPEDFEDDREAPTGARVRGGPAVAAGADGEAGGRRRRRRGRRGRGRSGEGTSREGPEAPLNADGPAVPTRESAGDNQGDESELGPRTDELGSDVPFSGRDEGGSTNGATTPGAGVAGPDGEGGEQRRRRRRRRRGRGGRGIDGGPISTGADGPGHTEIGAPSDGGAEADHSSSEAPVSDRGPDRNARRGNEPVGMGNSDSPHASAEQSSDAGEGEIPGGGRKRRRRRRGRGGRGTGTGADSGLNTGTPGGIPGAGPMGGPMNDAANRSSQAQSNTDDQSYDRPLDGPDDGPRDGPADGPVGEGGEPRRRRRRRRGRGGRGGEGADGGAPAIGAGAPAQGGREQNAGRAAPTNSPPPRAPTPRREARPDDRATGQGGRSSPGGRAPAQPAPSSRSPRGPAASPQAKEPPKPKVRVLYSSRRKLGPGEKRGLGAADE